MAKSTKTDKLKPGGRKGGTRFPNYSLKDVLDNVNDLISKTHLKPINIQQVNAGVFKVGAGSVYGKIRFSSMKQFGLVEGEYDAIKATQLASEISLASEDEKIKFIRQAFMNVPQFKNTFETFQASTVSKAKIKNYGVSPLKVHPDLSERFLESFLESAVTASMCTINNEEVKFISSKEIADINPDNENDDFEKGPRGENNSTTNDQEPDDGDTYTGNRKPQDLDPKKRINTSSPQIGIQLDASLDPDKLAKQLKILRDFGLI